MRLWCLDKDHVVSSIHFEALAMGPLLRKLTITVRSAQQEVSMRFGDLVATLNAVCILVRAIGLSMRDEGQLEALNSSLRHATTAAVSRRQGSPIGAERQADAHTRHRVCPRHPIAHLNLHIL